MSNSFKSIDAPLITNEKSRFVRINGKRPTSDLPKTEIDSLDFETILFIGSGAVDRGWEPIQQLCAEIVSGKFNGIVSYGLNNQYFYNEPYDHFITSIAFVETFVRSQLHKFLPTSPKTFSNNEAIKMLSNALETRNRLANFFQSNSSLTLRNLNSSKYGLDLEKTLVVTSNWDDCVWSHNQYKNVIYLHGHSSIQNSLVLPTQFVTDEYQLQSWVNTHIVLKSNCYNNIKQNLGPLLPDMKLSLASSGNQALSLLTELSYAHDLFREALNKKFSRLFIWGYGFNLYDAEINLLLTLASQMHTPRVDILNPDPTVMLKAAQVLAREINKIFYHHPYK